MATKKKSVKKAAKKKVVKKVSKKSSSKKPVVKKTSRVAKKKTPEQEVVCCAACHSPKVEQHLIGGAQRYLCFRCGHVSIVAVHKTLSEAKQLVASRKSMTSRTSHVKRSIRRDGFFFFLDSFYARMYFRIVGLFLLFGGFVLTVTSLIALGVVCALMGVFGLWLAERV